LKKYLVAGIVILAVAVMGGLFVAGNQTSPKQADVALLGVKHPNQGQEHIAVGAQHIAYNSNIPSSGPHYVDPMTWGIHDTELPDETLVHNQEHGGIVIAYKPDLAPVEIDQLKTLVAALPKSTNFNEIKVVLIPRTANDQPIQIGAWTYTLGFDTLDSAKITQFYNDHLDKGPELVP
jgi:hypothetical protein